MENKLKNKLGLMPRKKKMILAGSLVLGAILLILGVYFIFTQFKTNPFVIATAGVFILITNVIMGALYKLAMIS